MAEEAVLVALPGTMCSPAVFDPLARALAGEFVVDPVSWLTQPGPWDIPAVADRVADHIERSWGRPVLVCGHSTGGAIALQLAIRRPAALDPRAVHDVLASQRDLDLTADLAGIRQPAFVVHGRHDRARPPQQGRELARSLPDAAFLLADAGHTPVYETPEAVAACVRDVLTRAAHPPAP